MKWQPPEFVEIRMDAEVSAYQDDLAPQVPAPEPLPARLPIPGIV